MSRFIYATQGTDGLWCAAIEPWEGISFKAPEMLDAINAARDYLEAIDNEARGMVGNGGKKA